MHWVYIVLTIVAIFYARTFYGAMYLLFQFLHGVLRGPDTQRAVKLRLVARMFVPSLILRLLRQMNDKRREARKVILIEDWTINATPETIDNFLADIVQRPAHASMNEVPCDHEYVRRKFNAWLIRQQMPFGHRTRRFQITITVVQEFYVVVIVQHRQSKCHENAELGVYRYVYNSISGTVAGGWERAAVMQPNNTCTDLLRHQSPPGYCVTGVRSLIAVINDD